MPAPTPTPEKRPINWGKASKQASFWILIVLIPVILISLGSAGRETAKISYNPAFRAQVTANNIDSVVFRDDYVSGHFKTPVKIGPKAYQRFTTQVQKEATEDIRNLLVTQGVVMTYEDPKPSITGWIVNFLTWALLIGFYVFFFRQMQAGGAKAFSFGKSKAKLLTGDTPKVTFTDVAGADEAKQELQEIIEFLRDPQKFTKLGGRLPKGALLVGPPGTGKTLLARAVAGEAGRPFFQMSGSDFVEMFVGVGASRVRDLFEQGKAHAPCII